MPDIELRDVSACVCRGVNLKIRDGELFVLLGRNGAGKTTLLDVIAGLTGYEGAVLFDGKSVDALPPGRRGVGYLFQDLVLFPHLDVASNVAYGARNAGPAEGGVRARVDHLLELVGVGHLSSRYPGSLSGGEAQRVALARALATSPDVLLLDEPMNSLDLQAQKHLRSELKRLQRQLRITTVYVTHNLEEAEELADRVGVIDNGRLEQVGSCREVFFYPRSGRVSAFIGAPNILRCDRCSRVEEGVSKVVCGDLSLLVAHEGGEVSRIALLPRDVFVSRTRPPCPTINLFKGVVTGIDVVDGAVRLSVRVGRNTLTSEVPRSIHDGMDISVGEEVFVKIKLRRIRVCCEDQNAGPRG